MFYLKLPVTFGTYLFMSEINKLTCILSDCNNRSLFNEISLFYFIALSVTLKIIAL